MAKQPALDTDKLAPLKSILRSASFDSAKTEATREEVFSRYQPIFSPQNLADLTAEDFKSFLLVKNNKHWTGLHRGGGVVADMDRLRGALRLLLDESLPIAERMNRLQPGEEDAINRFGRATRTAILHVVYPDRYGVWNRTAADAMKKLKLWPKVPKGARNGDRYERINRVLLRCSEELGVDLWTLDWLWWKVLEGKEIDYWKIAPGPDGAIWEECRKGGFITLGWGEIGSLEGLDRQGFEERRDLSIAENPEWTTDGLEQLWVFTNIQIGDRIVANRGTHQVLGIGTVTGEYEYVSGEEEYRHRLPVRWDDTTPKPVKQGGWRRTLIRLTKERFEEIVAPKPSPPVGSIFTHRTIELLVGLQENPTKDFYKEHKEAIQEHIQEPFQNLFLAVAKKLPEVMVDRLEVEKSLFSRIPKNDWGRGGAWPYYWGAFYAPEKKRIESPQLFAVIDADYFEYGFALGQYSKDERARMAAALQEVEPLLRDFEPFDEFEVGDRADLIARYETGEPKITARSWLGTHDAHEPRAGKVETAAEWIKLPFDEQVERVADAFRILYPLFLTAVEPAPLPEVRAYLEGLEPPPDPSDTYPITQMALDTGLELDTIERWLRALERKGQAVLYGPPGTGKTYIAKKIARHLTGGTTGFAELVQFHPSYTYEDFLQGIRPLVGKGGDLTYELQDGVFVEFCRRARNAIPAPCVMILDEINRANLSQVFGEMMYLLEYRSERARLAAGGRPFSIPSNVRLIGTMNTADRSIALVDHALRRRFAFLELRPDYGALEKFHTDPKFEVEELVRVLERINEAIGDRSYELGISFFLLEDLEIQLEDIWKMEIEPYLEEYFFDKPAKVEPFRWEKVNSDILA